MQKEAGLVLGGLLVLTFVMAEASAADRYVYRGGKPQGRLFVPASDTNSPVRLAEQELQDHLEAMTGTRLEAVVREAKPGEPGLVLAVRPEREWRGKESAQAFVIDEDGEAGQVRIVGNTALAVLYGAYQYLNDQGVRWFTPGEIGANIPKRPDIPIRPGKRPASPSFASRVLALSSTADNHFGGVSNRPAAVRDYTLYLMRNRTQLARNIAKGFGFDESLTGSSHAVKPMTGLTREAVKAGLMDREPERFALVTGADFVQKRCYEEGQVCLSNEKNIQTAISNSVAFFTRLEAAKPARNSDLDDDATVPMGLSDTFGICECPSCKAVAGKDPNSKDRLVWGFWNRVARGLNAALPGRMIAVFTPYLDLTQPPDDVKIESNILAVTPLVFSWEKADAGKPSFPFPATFVRWAARTREAGATLGCYNYLNFPWSPTPLLILDGAQAYARLGCKHYHVEAMQRTEYTWPIVWALAQFTWDSTRDPRDYLKQFCREYYGTPYDADILGILEEMTRHACEMERINFGGASDTAMMLPDEMIGRARPRLTAAVRGAQGREQERLRRFAVSMEAQFQLAETYRAYSQALNTRAAGDIAAFTNRATGLQVYWKQENLDAITTSNRTPAAAAGLFLKTDFTALKPMAQKALIGKVPADERWMKELFAGCAVPSNVPNLFPLPELWKFHIDYRNEGLAAGYFKPDYDDRLGWPALSSWNNPSAQGYNSQVGGYLWHRVTFQAPVFPAGKKVFLRIGSLDDSGDVYLNGAKVGSQPEPRDWDKSFVMDVTQTVKSGGANVLAVRGYDSGGGEGVWRPSALYTE
jgi:hypothetical protein